MRLISRYIFSQATSALLLIMGSLSGIVWIALALRQLDVVTSQGQDTVTLITMTTLALPNLMAIVAPFSFLIASLHTLNRMNTDSELIVLTASGATIWTVARPLLVLAGLLSVFLAVTAHFVQPWSMRVLKDYIVQVRTDLLTQVIQPGRFSSPENGLMFHIRERAPNGELRGLLMHDTRNAKDTQSYLAERGVIVEQEDGSYLVMSDGHILRRANANDAPQIVAFDNYAISLDEFVAEDGSGGEYRPRERYFSELWSPEPDSKLYQRQPGTFRAELHERIASPLYPIAFALIVVGFVGVARSTRSSQVESLIIAFVVAAVCRLGGLALNNLSAANAAFVPVVYLLPIGAILAALLMIRRGRRHRPESAWLERITSLAAKLSLRGLRPRRHAATEAAGQ